MAHQGSHTLSAEGFSPTAPPKGATLDAAARKQTSDIIDHQVHGMSQLIDDLLSASRLRLGNLELRRTIVTVSQIIRPGGEIHIGWVRDGNEAVITVSDNGIGIASAQLNAIFDIWAQAGQAATERSEGGVGIGLYLARRVIEAHGGSVHAASDGPGLGSQFTVRLPRRTATPPSPD